MFIHTIVYFFGFGGKGLHSTSTHQVLSSKCIGMETQQAKTSLQDLQSLANTVLDNSDVLKKNKKKEKKKESSKWPYSMQCDD